MISKIPFQPKLLCESNDYSFHFFPLDFPYFNPSFPSSVLSLYFSLGSSFAPFLCYSIHFFVYGITSFLTFLLLLSSFYNSPFTCKNSIVQAEKEKQNQTNPIQRKTHDKNIGRLIKRMYRSLSFPSVMDR